MSQREFIENGSSLLSFKRILLEVKAPWMLHTAYCGYPFSVIFSEPPPEGGLDLVPNRQGAFFLDEGCARAGCTKDWLLQSHLDSNYCDSSTGRYDF